MSTRTSESARRGTVSWLVLGAVLTVSGCLDVERVAPATAPGLAVGAEPAAAETRVYAAPGGLQFAGPPGYCVDRDNTQASGSSGFVLLGGCDVLAGADRGPRQHAILSATYAPLEQPTSLAELSAFFETRAGRALLSRSGEASSVTILDNSVEDHVLFLHVHDTSPNAGAPLAPEHWRAALLIGGYGLMLSVHATRPAPLARGEGHVKIGAFARAVQRVN